MVDLANVAQAMALKSELQTIVVALASLEQGGRITAINIAPPPPPPLEQPEGAEPLPPPPPPPAPMAQQVSTANIDFPPQLAQMVKQVLTQRRVAIAKEFAGMGITGAE